MQRMSKRVGALVTPVHAVVLSVFVAPATACDSKAFAIVEGRYKPEVTVPNAECYDLVWDFNYGSYAYVEDSTTFELAIGPDYSGEFPGTLDFYPCILDGMDFDCSCDTATYPDPASCEGRDAEEVDLFTAEGSWTSSTAFDVTFTYRRAIVWEDGTDTTCPDVCTSTWDFTEVLYSPL